MMVFTHEHQQPGANRIDPCNEFCISHLRARPFLAGPPATLRKRMAPCST